MLFDMDGTLVDSEKLWTVALQEMALEYGGTLSDAARRAIVGTSSLQTMRILHADLGQEWRDPARAAQRLDSRVMELFAEGLQWRPGARELLHHVRGDGVKTALVTNTRRALADVVLGTIGAHNFDAVICGDEVPRGKPDPAPYLLAASALGVDPSWCVAIEDSPAGVASARAAGCAVVAVPHEVALVDSEALVLSSLVEADLALLRGLLPVA